MPFYHRIRRKNNAFPSAKLARYVRCAALAWRDTSMDEHPKGALTFMLIYLVFITLIWVNAYLRLWLKG